MQVKSLLVRFGSDIKAMEAGFKKADSFVQNHAAKFKKAGRTMTVAGAAITGALGLMIKKYVEVGDWVDKMSKRTGISAESLSELAYACEITGANLGDVEKGVKKMAKSITDADAGLETYLRSFRRIGIDINDLKNLKPEDQFIAIGSAIAGLSSETEKAATAQEIFGRAGTTLLPLFAEGKAGIEALRKEAHKLGIVFDAEAAAKAATLKDAQTALSRSFQGVGFALADTVIPALTQLVGKITNGITKVKDWVTENPKLAKTLVKVAGGIGILLTILGPLAMALPFLSKGFSMMWKAALGPVGIVIGVITAFAMLGPLIIKHWEPIKAFFIKLWEDVSGFFVNAFNAIKGKMLDWSIAIVGILEKIPIVKKLAGPWKESLQAMRDEMDKTAENVEIGAAVIEGAAYKAGFAWAKSISETEGFKKIWEKIGKAAAPITTEVAKASEKIAGLIGTMTDEIKKFTLSEADYNKWALDKKLADRIQTIGDEEATEAEKNKAIAIAKKVHLNEIAALDKTAKAGEAERQRTLADEIKASLKSLYDAQTARREAAVAEEKTLTESIAQLSMDKFDFDLMMLQQKYDAEKLTTKNLLLLTEEFELKKKEIEDAAAVDRKAKGDKEKQERKERWENTLSDIGWVMGQIGGLLQQSFQNQMDRIDQEEEAKIASINSQYDAQIEANKALMDAEQKKTQEILDAIDREYEAKRQAILANMEDNEERAALLTDLEKAHEEELAAARTAREAAEKATADKLAAIEKAKNEALRIASEVLEAKRAAARKKAAKQEKAVALLSAIVNTAAAIVKALPVIPLAIAVGILGAAQIAVIAGQRIPLKQGGIVTKRTDATLGEAGPEAVIPLNKFNWKALQPAGGMQLKQYVYFYGNISNAGSLDEISESLALRARRAMEQGR